MGAINCSTTGVALLVMVCIDVIASDKGLTVIAKIIVIHIDVSGRESTGLGFRANCAMLGLGAGRLHPFVRQKIAVRKIATSARCIFIAARRTANVAERLAFRFVADRASDRLGAGCIQPIVLMLDVGLLATIAESAVAVSQLRFAEMAKRFPILKRANLAGLGGGAGSGREIMCRRLAVSGVATGTNRLFGAGSRSAGMAERLTLGLIAALALFRLCACGYQPFMLMASVTAETASRKHQKCRKKQQGRE